MLMSLSIAFYCSSSDEDKLEKDYDEDNESFLDEGEWKVQMIS
jgi:hypothetical protein